MPYSEQEISAEEERLGAKLPTSYARACWATRPRA